MGLGFLFMIVLWGGLVLLVVLLVRSVRSRSGNIRHDGPENPNSAIEVLEQRFARGEIDQDEFEKRRRALDQSGGSTS